VSRDLLEQYPDVVRQFIGRNAGIYALYRKKRLQYVGLASKLSGRLKAHLRDRHSNAWDRFSIYLTIKDQHLKEIECLLLQIAKPRGNKVGGKPIGSRDMRRRIQMAIRQKQNQTVAELFGRRARDEDTRTRLEPEDFSRLLRLLPRGARLRGVLNGKVYRGRVRADGRIRYDGALFDSLSSAARAALRRRANGWHFWRVERGRGNWVRLQNISKAGTPIYPA
jgi:hypothetical protein